MIIWLKIATFASHVCEQISIADRFTPNPIYRKASIPMAGKSKSSTTVKNRKPFAIAMLVVIAWFIITGVFGPLFGKLTSVQENNNSSFLPKGAEATQASEVIQTFSGKDSFNFPTLILFEGDVTPKTIAAVNDHIAKVGSITLDGTSAKISDYLAPNQQITVFPSQDGKAILGNIPLDGNSIAKLLPNDKPVLPAIVDALRADIKPIAEANGLSHYVTGPGGLLGDLFGAFGTLDSSLLLTTLAVVAIILIVVYRSPILWIIPLISAGDYPFQHLGGDGLPRWTQANRSIENTDVVMWYVFGLNHIPRIEDWPVMPVERLGFMLKPMGFFKRTPAMDVAPNKAICQCGSNCNCGH